MTARDWPPRPVTGHSPYEGKPLPGVRAAARAAGNERLGSRLAFTALLVVTALMTTALIVLALG